MLKKLLPGPLKNKIKKTLFGILEPKLDQLVNRQIDKRLMTDRALQERLKFKLELLELERGELLGAEISPSRDALLETAVRSAERSPKGLWMEFGVMGGRSLRVIAPLTKNTVYGFDSFVGLPEDWVKGRSKIINKGKMSQHDQLPDCPPNVEFVKGWFEDSLPKFVREHPEPAAFVHIDSDLYSSAKTIFEHIKFQVGTVIIFDEYFNYPYWKEHEYKAFHEYLAVHPFSAKCLAYFPGDKQAVFILEPKNGK